MARAGRRVDVCRRVLRRTSGCSSSRTSPGRRRGPRIDEARAHRCDHVRAARAGERVRARRLRPDDGVRAARMDPDPPRPDRPFDHEGGRLPDARERRDDPLRPLLHALEGRAHARPARDDRRARLRGRPDADRRAGPADEGDGPLVPVRRDAPALHLHRQPARVHPAAVDRRDLARRADVGDLCGDELHLGDARARAAHLRLHARRGHPLERAGQLLQELDPRGAEAAACADRAARDPRPVHAADLASASGSSPTCSRATS